MYLLNLKPTSKPVKQYYSRLKEYHDLSIDHEGAVRAAFQSLLESCASQFKWVLVNEWKIKRQKQSQLSVDGALVDAFKLTHGYWEAKDMKDDLDLEVKKKFAVGYPKDNILFQTPKRVILYQDGKRILDEDITQPEKLVSALKTFFEYQPPLYAEWEQAVEEFQERVPQLAGGLVELIEQERKTNKKFIAAFAGFMELSRASINPNLSEAAIEEMLIQHLLTERIFSKVFNNPDFARRNVIAHEIENVIDALTSQSFSKSAFLSKLDPFYNAIEGTAATIEDFTQKQGFLNTVYEKFFQGFSVKVADTHGIVYTPQPIAGFMVRSVQEVLKREFGKSIGDKGVHLLDPFVGTGNFVVRLMQEIPKTMLAHKYQHEIHCNEVMLLPYYIASMNIEHEYFEKTGEYKPFEGICLVDTFEMAEQQQGMFTTENTARIVRQNDSPIFVIIGNPPYNVGQLNENDNNKNRKYKRVDERVASTYAKSSTTTLKKALSDPYVKAFRWATDRLTKDEKHLVSRTDEGIIAFVTNNGFLDGIAFDGMRKHLAQDFNSIYILDLGGNVRKNPKLSGSTHNVFGIQVGVCICILVKKKETKIPTTIYYARVDEFWRKEQKYDFLDKAVSVTGIEWKEITPDARGAWLTEGIEEEFDCFIPIGIKQDKGTVNVEAIFSQFSPGVLTARDTVVFDFDTLTLSSRVKEFGDMYNVEVNRYLDQGMPGDIDGFVNYSKIKWSEQLKRFLQRGSKVGFQYDKIRRSMYRPFSKSYLYFDETMIDRRGRFPRIFPTSETESENCVICVPGKGNRMGFSCFVVNLIPAMDFSFEKAQCFPYYFYDEDGTNRRENITNWALQEFQSHYNDPTITKWDIFYHVYALLHHPEYRTRYAANLKRDLPHIPFVSEFRAFAQAGEKLADLHINYESQPEYSLQMIENPDLPLDWRVDKMKLSKDKTQIEYNGFLTLAGIPEEVFEYRLGNRSALDWVIDQYRVKTDERSGITNDPNRLDDPDYIVRLVKQVITVSLETMKIVKGLPELVIETINEGITS